MSTHYVCTGGCLTVRYAPTNCQVPGCPRHRNPLTECTCEDDEHGELLFRNHPNREAAEAAYRESKKNTEKADKVESPNA